MEKIRYHEKISYDREYDCHVIDIFGSVEVPTEHVRYYGDSLQLFKNLSGTDVRIFLFLLEAMDTTNLVSTDTVNRANFIKVMQEDCKDRTFRNSITKLKKEKLLIPKRRGYSYINPIYFFKGYKKDREELIKYLLSATKEFEAKFKEKDLII